VSHPSFRPYLCQNKALAFEVPSFADYFRAASDELNILEKNMVQLVYYPVMNSLQKKSFLIVWGAKPINKE
jgi:hypothetical protein